VTVFLPLLLLLSIVLLLSSGMDWPPLMPPLPLPQPPPCLLVYHIPKTGGTSVQAYLRRVAQTLQWEYRDLDRWAVANPGQLPPPGASRAARRGGGGVVHEGHITPLYESLTDTRQCAKLTVLRDPVDRVVSAFRSHPHTNHSIDVLRACLATTTTPPQQQHRTTTTGDGPHFVTSAGPCPWDFEYRNDVTRRFANRGRWWNSFERDRYLLQQRRQQLPQRRPGDGMEEKEDGLVLVLEPSEDDLDRAMMRLRTMTAVCFLSDLAGCMERFVRRTYGVEQPFGPDLMYNVGPGDGMGPITPTLRREIARANALDVRLYEWALETFQSNGTTQSIRLPS